MEIREDHRVFANFLFFANYAAAGLPAVEFPRLLR